jgi:transposase
MELFSWRQFRNRRQVGAVSGLTATPHDSGDQAREQGISKAGIVHVRSLAIEMAWAWLRFQPRSELSQWSRSVSEVEGPGCGGSESSLWLVSS